MAEKRPQEIINLYTAYKTAMWDGYDKTRIDDKSKIEMCLPVSLQPAFRDVSGRFERIKDVEATQKLISYLNDDLFGPLPKFTDPIILPDHANGFFINGQFRSINMDGKVAKKELIKTMGLIDDLKDLPQRVYIKLKDRGYNYRHVQSTVSAYGGVSLNREIVAVAIQMAQQTRDLK